jgi:hypothetical protein
MNAYVKLQGGATQATAVWALAVLAYEDTEIHRIFDEKFTTSGVEVKIPIVADGRLT